MRLLFGHPAPLPAAERFRREHEEWLTAALRSRRPFPRIPLRCEDTGGFDRLRARPTGPARAQRWWELALARIPHPFREA